MDDMLIASRDKSEIQKLKSLLNSEFEIKHMGAARKILGMEIRRDHAQNKLFLCQKKYIQKVLNHFGMATTKSMCTPSITSIHLFELNATQSKSKKEYMSYVPYANVWHGMHKARSSTSSQCSE